MITLITIMIVIVISLFIRDRYNKYLLCVETLELSIFELKEYFKEKVTSREGFVRQYNQILDYGIYSYLGTGLTVDKLPDKSCEILKMELNALIMNAIQSFEDEYQQLTTYKGILKFIFYGHRSSWY